MGESRELTAAALLAPAAWPSPATPAGNGGDAGNAGYDGTNLEPPSRTEAKRICAAIALRLAAASGGRIARYSDALEPRAFGEYFQGKGAATVLVESGHLRNDPAKHQARKLTFIGILSALEAITAGVGTGAGTAGGLPASAEAYEQLPFNGKRAYDVVVRNVAIADPRRKSPPLDLGISFQVDTHPEEPPRLVDMGDLDLYTGVEEIDGTGVSIPRKALELNRPFEYRSYFT